MYSDFFDAYTYLETLTEWEHDNPPFDKGMLVAIYNDNQRCKPVNIGRITGSLWDGDCWRYTIEARQGLIYTDVKSWRLDKLGVDECRAWIRRVK